MQIVIDIPKEKVERLIRQMKLDRNFKECKIVELPKVHGRLIDADAFKKNVCTYQQTGCGDCKHSLCCPEDVPTIIEADTEDTAEREDRE